MLESRQCDKDLRDRVIADPDRCWPDFLASYADTIRRVVRRYGLSVEDQQDVFQEVNKTLIKGNLKALRAWDPNACSLPHYLTIITNRTAINFVKSAYHTYAAKKMDPMPPEEVVPRLIEHLEDPACSARERLQRLQVIQGFRQTLARLIETNRIRQMDSQLIALRLRGLTYQEVGGFVGLPKATVVTRLSRLKAILREELIRSGIEPSDLSS